MNSININLFLSSLGLNHRRDLYHELSPNLSLAWNQF